MKVYELFPQQLYENSLLDTVRHVAHEFAPELHVSIHQEDGDGWNIIKLGNQSAAFKINGDLLELANVYIPTELRSQGFMTALLIALKAKFNLKFCKVHAAMENGWKARVQNAGLEWVSTKPKEISELLFRKSDQAVRSEVYAIFDLLSDEEQLEYRQLSPIQKSKLHALIKKGKSPAQAFEILDTKTS